MCGTPSSGAPLSDLVRSLHAGWNLGAAKETLKRIAISTIPLPFLKFTCWWRKAPEKHIVFRLRSLKTPVLEGKVECFF